MKAKLTLRLPWEPEPEEPAPAYGAFRLYLEAGPSRSLAGITSSSGLSLGRLKQLSARWHWSLRAVAWEEHEFRQRCRTELNAQAEAHTRLLKESGDWQRLARADLNRWVRRGPNGELELARALTPNEAIRLWLLGCQAERHLRGLQAAAIPIPDPKRVEERFRAQIQRACDDMRALCERAGASHRHRNALEDAFRGVAAAWSVAYVKDHPEVEANHDLEACLWPWDLPLREPS
jgi:hypothetical protein